MKLFNKCVLCCFHYLKSILIDDLLNTSTQWFLLNQCICYNKNRLLFQLVVMNLYQKQCIFSVRKKNSLLWKRHKYQHSADIFVKTICKPFHDTGLFLYSLKTHQKTRGFLMFSACMCVKSHLIFIYLFCYLCK